MPASCRRSAGGELGAGARDLLDGVEQRAVVDAHGVGVLVLDEGAVHEGAEVAQRAVVQLGAGDARRDGRGERGRDLVHVGEAVGERDRQLVAGGALGDAGADRFGERELAAQVVRLLGRDAEVGADGGDPVRLRAGRRGPASSRGTGPAGRRARAPRCGCPGPGCAGSPRGRARGRAAARSGCAPARGPRSRRCRRAVRWPGRRAAGAGRRRARTGWSGAGRQPMQGTSWPRRISIAASRSMPSGEIVLRGFGASSSCSSATRASVPSTPVALTVVTSKSAGAGASAGRGSVM